MLNDTGLVTLVNPAYGTAVTGRVKPEYHDPRCCDRISHAPNSNKVHPYGLYTLVLPDGSTYKNEGCLYPGTTDKNGRAIDQ